jgi:3-dehydroquinate synthetase
MSAELQPSANIKLELSGVAAEQDVLCLDMSVSREIRYQIVHPVLSVFDALEPTLANLVDGRSVLIVIDSVVDSLYGDALRCYADGRISVADVVIMTGEEANKSWDQTRIICEAAIECQLGRHGVIVGVGGGVTLDVAGFAASVYRRGVSYLRIPTTLIGQVDVSIGVKQGINSGSHKNIVGSFFPPIASVNDVSFLHSLPHSQLAAGLAEILKIALIRDSVLFDLVETYAAPLLTSGFARPRSAARLIMERAERGMLRELQDNLFETRLKRPVDFGHTFSPAIESASKYSLPHGHAVGVDMAVSTFLAVQMGLCAPTVLRRLLSLCRVIGIPVTQKFCSAAELHAALDRIRSHRGGHLNLVVPTEIGASCFLQEVKVAELEAAIVYLGSWDRMHEI